MTVERNRAETAEQALSGRLDTLEAAQDGLYYSPDALAVLQQVNYGGTNRSPMCPLEKCGTLRRLQLTYTGTVRVSVLSSSSSSGSERM